MIYKWIKFIFILILFFFSLFIDVPSTNAHPGNTDAYGCHTCRTNCPRWGLSYGEYHCHSSKIQTPIIQQTPSCPLMSYYDSTYNKCVCYSGYIPSGGQCISNNQYCWNRYGYGSMYDYSSSSCKCLTGYEFNGSRCVFSSKF